MDAAGAKRFPKLGLNRLARQWLRHFARRAMGMREKNDAAGIETAAAASSERPRAYFAAVTMISTLYCGAASRASTVARAGVLPGETQASHTAFISAKVLMSVM